MSGIDHLKKPFIANAVAIAILLCVIILLFPGVFTPESGGKLISEGGDLYSIYEPFRVFGFAELKKGNLPLWNPYIFSGAPFLADPETALLYPFNWIHFALSARPAMNLSMILHIFLAGLFMYLWAAKRGMGVASRLLCALLFSLGAPQILTVTWGFLSNLCTLAWAPLVFLSIDMVFDGQNRRALPVGAAAVSMQILAGNTQYMYYTALASLIYVAARLLSGEKKGRAVFRVITYYALIYLLASGISAVQLLTSAQTAAETVRGGGTGRAFAAMLSYPAEGFMTLVCPDFFGDGLNVPVWSRWYLWKYRVFISITGLILAVVGAVWGEKKARNKCVVMAAVCALLGMGAFTPLFGLLYHMLPGFAFFRGTSKMLFLTAMFLVILAGAGFDAVIMETFRRDARGRGRLLRNTAACLMLGAVLCLTAVAVIKKPLSGEASVVWKNRMNGLSVEDRMVSIRGLRDDPQFVRGTADIASGELITAAVIMTLLACMLFFAAVERRLILLIWLLSVFEILVFASAQKQRKEPRAGPLPERIIRYLREEAGSDRVFWPEEVKTNRGMVDRVRFLWGDYNFVLRRYAEFMFFTQGLPFDKAGHFVLFQRYNELYRILRSRYLVLPSEYGETGGSPLLEEAGLRVEEDRKALPRVFLWHRWEIIDDTARMLSAISASASDPASVVLLEENPGIGPEGGGGEGDSVEVLDGSTDHLDIRARTGSPAVLVITDAYSRGWLATDLSGRGERYKLMPAYHTLKAVPLRPGTHHIRVEYLPSAFRAGKVVSFVSAALFIALVIVSVSSSSSRGQKR